MNTSRFFTLKRTRRCGIGRLSFLLLLCSLSLSLVAFLWRAFIFDCFLIRFLFVKNRKKRKKIAATAAESAQRNSQQNQQKRKQNKNAKKKTEKQKTEKICAKNAGQPGRAHDSSDLLCKCVNELFFVCVSVYVCASLHAE